MTQGIPYAPPINMDRMSAAEMRQLLMAQPAEFRDKVRRIMVRELEELTTTDGFLNMHEEYRKAFFQYVEEALDAVVTEDGRVHLSDPDLGVQ